MVLPYGLFLPAYVIAAYIWVWMPHPTMVVVYLGALWLVWVFPFAFFLSVYVIVPTQIH